MGILFYSARGTKFKALISHRATVLSVVGIGGPSSVQRAQATRANACPYKYVAPTGEAVIEAAR